MFARFLAGLAVCAAIGTAVGSYVDRGGPPLPGLAPGPTAAESPAMQSCLDRARVELDRLDPTLGYLERDLRHACAVAIQTSVVSHYHHRRTWSGAAPPRPRSRYN